MSKMSGKRFKKKTGTKSAKNLPKTDLDWLSKNTHFSPANIVEWHKGFLDDCPDGRMNRDKMKEMFNAITPQGKSGEQFLDQLFRIFDKDGDGSIDFKEFMIATDMTSRGDPEEKLRWAFRMYDKDGSGEIEMGEMVEIFCLMYSIQGYTEEEATERAEKIFKSLDNNGDGTLEEEEFIKGCLADEELLELLNAGGIGGGSQ
ncbi:neuronal calcium sensor 2 isoform X2 [Eurytemora carolleeae]|uniref:neuronal calcium sensor 2 isoform X2 n=1 Tax=Eurytemora carolleeae TaxID=1294199 RepID=UPI000C77DEE3|nr:neuronal calcium sensor 2 isoform X2 [Eurytemora carolleeae]|eukprot:XP_023335010.1 neuronal calcium sensor 2-like isoform X2 [Eurytemora affinis]